MIVKAFTLLILVSYAIGELCVNYDFEQGFNELFSDNGVCHRVPLWFIGKYEDLNMIGENGSTIFIKPSSQSSASCASSFVFSMKSGGTIEVDIYMERSDVNDQIQVFVSQVVAGGGSIVRAKAESGVSGYSANGTQILKITLNGTDNYEGFISIVGKAAPESVVLVDAFRYTPPNIDDTYCQDPKNVLNPFSNVNTAKRTTVSINATTAINETTPYNATSSSYNSTSLNYSTTLPTVTSLETEKGSDGSGRRPRPPRPPISIPNSNPMNLAPIITIILSLTVLSALD
uniref:SFRICE_014971 n=1 Tax=Spodoptera frugiperda TaxID=7108 RepID=A0A2H1VVS1_SPOFR